MENIDALRVVADGIGLAVHLTPGAAMIDGYTYRLSDDGGPVRQLVFDPVVGQERIDRVIVRLNLAQEARTMQLAILSGVPGVSTPPALARDDIVYELSLARVMVRPEGLITQEDIIDERENEAVCGLIQKKYDQKSDRATQTTTPVPAAAWQGDEPPYTQEVEVAGTKSGRGQNVIFGPVEDAGHLLTPEIVEAWTGAFIIPVCNTDGVVTLRAFGDKPEMDFDVEFSVGVGN